MSDFRAVLDDEVGKAVDDSIKKNHALKSTFIKPFAFRKYFSFSTFIKVTLFWGLALLCAILWFWTQKTSTMDALEGRLASKTVLIEKNADLNFRISNTDPIIEEVVISEEGFEEDSNQNADNNNETVNAVSGLNDNPVSVNNSGLADAPIPDLFESTEDGLIPKARLSDGLTPFNAYRRPFTSSSVKPKLSFVAVNVGMSRKITEQMISDLPPEISFAFSPYAPDIKLLGDASRSAGHEMWLMLPMENEDYPRNDPGPNTLLVNASIEQNQARLLSTLGRAVGYVGVVSWPNHIFTAKDIETSPTMQQIYGRGLAGLNSSPRSDRDFGKNIAFSNEFPYAKNNFWLEPNMSEAMMARKLEEACDFASANTDAIIMFYPTPNIIKFLSSWFQSNLAKEFELAPASYIAEYKDE